MSPAISSARFATLTAATKPLRIAVIGDLMLDTYISGSAHRLSQEAPVPVLRVRSKSIRLGGAANVMRNLKALSPDAKVYAFGIVGVDEPGEKLRALLAGARINTNGIVGVPGRVTIEKQRVLAGNQQIVRMDFEETAPIETDIRDRLIETVTAKIRTHELDALVIEDYAKGLIGQEMLDALVKTARAEGVFTSLDPHPGNPVQTKGISLMTPNRAEAFALAGIYCSDPVDDPARDAALQEVAAKIRREWAPEILLITLGHQGMALYSDKEPRVFVDHRSPSSSRRKEAAISAGSVVAVPALPTTIPAAWLEITAASRSVAPAAWNSVKAEMTVSPAPETSKTSRAMVGITNPRGSLSEYSAIP